MNTILGNIGGIGSAKCTNILWKSFTATKITDGLSAINLSWLRSIKRHNKSLSSSLSSLVAYPLLAFVIITLAACSGSGDGGTSGVDVDVDNDGLIEIRTVADLNNIRYNLDGTSLKNSASASGNSFGCPNTGCRGYELMADIDLADAGNWDPIGSCTADNTCKNYFNATFEGNDNTISNIRIELNTNIDTYGVGFFAAISKNSNITGVILSNVNIVLRGSKTTYTDVGGLVGYADRGATIEDSDVVNMIIDKQFSVTIDLSGSLVGDYGDDNKPRNSKSGAISQVVTIVNRAPNVGAVDLNITDTSQDAVANVESTGTYADSSFTAYAYIHETDDLIGIEIHDQIEVTFTTTTPTVCDFGSDGATKVENISVGFPAGGVHSVPATVTIKDTAECIINAIAEEMDKTSDTKTYKGTFPDTPPTFLPVGTDNIIDVSAGGTETVTIEATKTDPGSGVFTNKLPQAAGCTIERSTSIGATSTTGVDVGDTYTIAEYSVSHDAGLGGGSCSFDVTASEDDKALTIPQITVNFNRKADVDGDGLIEIYTADELNNIRYNLDGTSLKNSASASGNSAGCPTDGCRGYELMEDIDLVAAGYDTWEPLGSCTADSTCADSFKAVFVGNGFTISNIIIKLSSSTPTYGVGFFAAISANSALQKVALGNVNISLSGNGIYTDVGGLVGFADSGARIDSSTVVNIVIEGTSSANDVGGLVGDGSSAEIISSYAAVDSISVTGNNVGGLVGDGSSATITSSYAAVDSISVTGNNVGGLVGDGSSAVTNSNYAVAGDINVTGDNIGGLVGDGKGATITSSYALTANLTGTSSVDGLIGSINSATMVSSSYWLEGVFYTIGASPRTITRPSFTTPSRTTANSGESKTADDLRSPITATGIYSDWDAAWCDLTDGVFTTDSGDNIAIPANLAWNFGLATDYPALTCLTENISLANQRATSANVLLGKLPLEGIDRNKLN